MPVNGRGDACFRTALAYIAYRDRDFYVGMMEMLTTRKRWLGPPQKIAHYRSVNSWTHDPSVMGIAALWLTGHRKDIARVKLPWWQPSPLINAWKRFLMTGNVRFRKRFERRLRRKIRFGNATKGIRSLVERVTWLYWTRHVFGQHAYSMHLYAWMSYCALSKKAQFLVQGNAKVAWGPQQVNWLIVLLTDWDNYWKENWPNSIKRYVPKEGYQWDRELWNYDQQLPPGQTYYLDKDILMEVLSRG